MSARCAGLRTPVGTTNRLARASDASGERAISGLARRALEPWCAIAGKYRVRGELGRGGFAVVYDAEHLGLRREVALKVLHRSTDTPAMLLARFAREAHISALVRHPNVLQVHDVGVLFDGSPFLVMEKIQGETLHHYLCLAGRLTIEQTVELTRQLLSALVALAARGIVHRDIKPENLMLTYSDAGELSLKLVDFGVALLRDERVEPRLTMQGALVGTPHYMAPEQLRSELIDERVDIYATGVVMFQALTGSMPYDGDDLCALTLNVLHGDVRSLPALRPECPEPLVRIVERALSRSAERRFASAAHMLAALEGVFAEPRGWQRALRRPRCSSPGHLLKPRRASAALGIAALTGFLMWAPWLRDAPQPERPYSHRPLPTTAQNGAWETPTPEVHQLADSVLTQAPSSARPERSVASAPRARIHAIQAAALRRQALALYLHGDLEAAYSVYRKAARANPHEPGTFRGMALAAGGLGMAQEARRAYARYLELVPHATDAELVKARLDALITPAPVQTMH